jgi:hypothetical protein
MKTPARRFLSAALLLSTTAAGHALAGPPPPCGDLAQLRARFFAAPDAARRAAVANAFASCAEREKTPLLLPGTAPGSVRALLVFRAAAERVFLAGDMNGWSTASHPLE